MLVDKSIDCLATGEWKDYMPRYSGPHLPLDCPPIFLKCDNQPNYQSHAPGQNPWHLQTTTFGPPRRGSPAKMARAVLPRGAFDDGNAPVRAAGMGDYGGFMSSEVPHQVHQGLRRLGLAYGKAHEKGKAMFLQSHKPTGLRQWSSSPLIEPPMPKDPMTECQVASENVERFHQIRVLAPQLLPQLEIFLLLKLVLLLPYVVLGCLGFCWGKDLYERVNEGYVPVASGQQAQPQIILNPALGISAAPPTTESTQMSMAQPLMLSAPPVPSPQVTAISPPSHSHGQVGGQEGAAVQQ